MIRELLGTMEHSLDVQYRGRVGGLNTVGNLRNWESAVKMA